MLHQTLISSPSAALFNVCSSSSSPLRSFSAASHCSKVEKEEKMEVCETAENLLFSEEMEYLGGEKICEGFSVEDLLDLSGFGDNNELGSEEFTGEMSSEDNSSYNLVPMPAFDEISLPSRDDAAELEWVSLILDDTLSDIPQLPMPKMTTSSSPTTLCTLSTEAPVPVRAKRSKRPRSAPSHTSTTTSSASSSSSSVSSLFEFSPLPKKLGHKKRGRKPKPQLTAPAMSVAVVPGGGERRCTHCGVQKTPQWRAGPLGAKTLCNACGVRYKSGRLLPEYRPACSPTFVSSVHSNSHRKVLEMRRQKEDFPAAAVPPVVSF